MLAVYKSAVPFVVGYLPNKRITPRGDVSSEAEPQKPLPLTLITCPIVPWVLFRVMPGAAMAGVVGRGSAKTADSKTAVMIRQTVLYFIRYQYYKRRMPGKGYVLINYARVAHII